MSPGDQVRDYLEVKTLASLLVRILEQRHFDGTLNCCSGVPVTVRALVEARMRERGASIRLNTGRYNYPAYEPRAFWGDTTRLRQILGDSA